MRAFQHNAQYFNRIIYHVKLIDLMKAIKLLVFYRRFLHISKTFIRINSSRIFLDIHNQSLEMYNRNILKFYCL